MIPAQAVEVAGRAIWAATGHEEGDWVCMAPENPTAQRYRSYAQAALEAAAPHMLAGALEEEAEGLSWLGAQGNTVEPDTAWAGVRACRDIMRRRAAELRAK